ncbi:MAG: MarR family winged helix-turn-helix transcriptional regulator [Alphaproteobacteria bacterium]
MSNSSTRRAAQKTSAARINPARAGTARFTDDYLPFLLAQTSAVACAAFADALRSAHLSNLAWRIMATLGDEGPLSVGRLSEIVLARQPRVTQIVNDLVKAGFVERRALRADGRVTMVEISARGRKRIDALLGAARAREAFAHDAVGPAGLRQLKSLLRQLLQRAGPARD